MTSSASPSLVRTRKRFGANRTAAIGSSLALLALVCLGVAISEPSAYSTLGGDLLLAPALALAFAAEGEMIVVLVGDFDLGVGYAVGLANVLSATLLVSDPLLGVLSLLGLVAAYVVQGLFAEVSNVPAIVVTLGTSFLWLGIGLIIQPTPGGSAPGWLERVANGSLPIVPEPVYILVGISAVMWWLVGRSRTGLRLRALGNSRQSLDHSGWSARRTRLVAYGLAGLCVVLAGLMSTAISLGSDENASSAITLSAFVVLVLGGCRFGVGRVEPVGVVAAAIFLTVLTSLLAFYHVPSIYTTGAEGVILVGAVVGRWLIGMVRQPNGAFSQWTGM